MIGLVNIQFVILKNEVYVIEVNPRSSRTVPFLSKVTNIPMANLATQAILGTKLTDLGYKEGLWPEDDIVSVKVPVFSFAKLRRVDPTLDAGDEIDRRSYGPRSQLRESAVQRPDRSRHENSANRRDHRDGSG